MKQNLILPDSRSFELLLANKRTLELMANNKPLVEILSAVVELIETFASGCISTVYFVVDGQLRTAAAPSWPEDFIKAVEGCPIGFNHGTCGHAAFTGKRAISTDVSKDEVWGPYRDWILSYGIKAAWSTPVIDEQGNVIATVSMCWKELRVPTAWDFEIVDTAVSLMKIAVNRKKQEEMIEEQRLKLVASSRLAAVGEMAANLAHEINNPLTIIQGYSSLLQTASKNQIFSPTSIQKASTEIEKTVGRISTIIKGLKAISKDGDQDPYLPADMNLVIEETVSFCRERYSKNNVKLTFQRCPEPIQVECRQVQVSQTLLNLLNNAFDAVLHLPEKWVQIDIKTVDHYCLMTVTDSGTGISTELQTKIMDPYFTTKPTLQGTGLGLSISQKIVSAHRGELKVNSKTKNTCFELKLPLKQEFNGAWA